MLVNLSVHYLVVAKEAARVLVAQMPEITSSQDFEVVPADPKAVWSWYGYESPVRVEVYYLPELPVDVRRVHFIVKLIGGHLYWSGFDIPIRDFADPRLSDLWIQASSPRHLRAVDRQVDPESPGARMIDHSHPYLTTAYIQIARNATRLFEEWRLLTCPLARFEPLHSRAPSTVWCFSETALKVSVQCPISTPNLAIFSFEVLIDGRLSMSACEILATDLDEPIDRLSDLKITPAIKVLCESVVAQLIKDRLDAEQ